MINNQLRPLDAATLGAAQLPTTFADLALGPGVTLICGIDERIARSLFRLLDTTLKMTGEQAYEANRAVYWHDAISREGNETTGRGWLEFQAQRYGSWNEKLAAGMVEALDLEIHISKPLYMYSLGSARKLNLVAAFASGVRVTCLDAPFAALDGPSRSVVAEFLNEASEHPGRSWMVFDYEPPPGLGAMRFAQVLRF